MLEPASRGVGLRWWLGASYGLLAVIFVFGIAIAIERAARDQLRNEIGSRLSAHALNLSSGLNDALYQHREHLIVFSQLPQIAALNSTKPEQLQRIIEHLQDVDSHFSWIALADKKGMVRAAGGALREGADLSRRPWFRNALASPLLTEVQLTGDSITHAEGSAPIRDVIVSAPILGPGGQTVGVLAAQLSWDWTTRVRDNLLQPLTKRDPVELFVIDKTGSVLIGPEYWRGKFLATQSVEELLDFKSGFREELWPDQHRYLTGYSATLGRPGAPGLGWSVIIRKPIEQAYAGLSALRHYSLIAAALASIVGTFAAVGLGYWIGKPLQSLATAATFLRERNPGWQLPPPGRYRESRQLNTSLDGLLGDLTERERELTELTQNLESRVNERTDELSQANAELERIAITDSLTGLYNRRFFTQQLTLELERARRHTRPLVLLLLDVDHFKAVNDNFGHAVGDRVLVWLAEKAMGALRKTDLLARVGGEEFAVLAIDTPEDDARNVAERLRATIEQETLQIEGRQVVVTISIGVARLLWAEDQTALPAGAIGHDLYVRADKALYRAKYAGRNRVVVDGYS